MTNKSTKFETIKPFCFLFRLPCERIFIKTHSIKSRCVIGPVQAGNFTGCGSDGVNAVVSEDTLVGTEIPGDGGGWVELRCHHQTDSALRWAEMTAL